MSGRKENKINYTLADIEQYLQGKLSPAEMHAMEKAALQDPFLADAIEGYRETVLPEAQDDLAAIRRKLLEEKEEARVIPVITKKTYGWRIAASILLMVGLGAAAWYLSDHTNNKTELAKQPVITQIKKDTVQLAMAATAKPVLKQPHKQEMLVQTVPKENSQPKMDLAAVTVEKELTDQKSSPITIAKDTAPLPSRILVDGKRFFGDKVSDSASMITANGETVMAVKTIPGTLTVGAQPNITSVGALKGLAVSGNIQGGTFSGTLGQETMASITSLGQLSNLTVTGNILANNTVTRSYVSGQLNVTGTTSGDLNKPLRSAISMQHLFTGKVLDQNLKPIPNASIVLGNTKRSTVTDANGVFTFTVPDSLQKITVSSVGFEVKKLEINSSRQSEVVLQENKQSLAEIVVTGYGNRKKKEMDEEDSDSEKLLPDSISPKGGWASLQTYLLQKIYPAQKDMAHVVHGKIKVQLVLTNGKVTDVAVIKTFDKSLNPLLIQALKDGPAWKSSGRLKKKEKRKVTLTF